MTRVGVAARRRVPLYNRAVLGVLRSPAHRVLDRSLVALRVRGRLRGEGVVLRPGQDGYGEALAAYQARWRRVRLPADQPVVRILLAGAGL